MTNWRDLGLTWEEAAHGVQSGVAYEESNRLSDATSPKHLRTGVNIAMVDHAALAYLLIGKGIITEEEYKEAIRQAMNDEVARYEEMHGVSFR